MGHCCRFFWQYDVQLFFCFYLSVFLNTVSVLDMFEIILPLEHRLDVTILLGFAKWSVM